MIVNVIVVAIVTTVVLMAAVVIVVVLVAIVLVVIVLVLVILVVLVLIIVVLVVVVMTLVVVVVAVLRLRPHRVESRMIITPPLMTRSAGFLGLNSELDCSDYYYSELGDVCSHQLNGRWKENSEVQVLSA